MEPQEVLSHPDPNDLPFDAVSIWAGLIFNYKGNKASGPSKLPTQLVKRLHMRNYGVISTMVKAIASTLSPLSGTQQGLHLCIRKG